jgi:hypothetical protein
MLELLSPLPLFYRSRKENLEKARTHLLAGNNNAAEDCYQKAVTITSSMTKQVIEVSQATCIP